MIEIVYDNRSYGWEVFADGNLRSWHYHAAPDAATARQMAAQWLIELNEDEDDIRR